MTVFHAAPGRTIGIVGGGQLGRMMALEAFRMGLRTRVLDPDAACSSAGIAGELVVALLNDAAALSRLADGCDVLTFETESVPAGLLSSLRSGAVIRPAPATLAIVQDRRAQRERLAAIGVPQTPHRPVDDARELAGACAALGFPAVLKTRVSGYDGKGQARITKAEDAPAAWNAIGGRPALLESFIGFEREISVILARDAQGAVRVYPVAENVHRNHVLHTTRVPARIPPGLAAEAVDIATRIANGLEHVGVMAVEMFVTSEERLLVNEVAARVHNTGHFTLGACATSQFEQHVRAICGWQLGDPSLLHPAVMVNLMGDLWSRGEPDFAALSALPNAHLHLYGKHPATAGRKMGHVLLLDDDTDRALAEAERLLARMGGGASAASR